jgi:hypothetical protein
MFNINMYMGCDKCNLFISKKFMHDPFCPDCGEKLRSINYYDIDEVESRRHLFKQCIKCESIFKNNSNNIPPPKFNNGLSKIRWEDNIKRKERMCLICRTPTLRRYR